MIRIPRGIPVKEKINPGKVNLPELLKKLQGARFTGSLRFETPRGAGNILFDAGRMLGAFFQGEGDLQTAGEALSTLFVQSLEGGAELNIYRLSSRLVKGIHALLNGPVRYGDQEVSLLDIRALLGTLKEEKFTGGIHVYADERAAMIFYRGGEPLGFFNEGAADVETTADLSRSVARLPGARINVLSASSEEEQNGPDLMESVDLAGLWGAARHHVARWIKLRQEELVRQKLSREREHRLKALFLLKEVAARHLGNMGLSLAEKEFEKAVGAQEKFSEEILNEFCCGIARTAKLVASPSAVTAMLDEMKKAVGALD